MSQSINYLTFTEVCLSLRVNEDAVFEMVNHGIAEPQGAAPDEWRFDYHMLARLRKARRLMLELELDTAAVALALELREELERVRAENQYLRQQLSRLRSP